MAGQTAKYQLPYPQQPDNANVPVNIKALCDRLEIVLSPVPTPVVNGQWVKGVGGAAVWSAIADADVPSLVSGPGRLGPNPCYLGSAGAPSDWNAIVASGWYMGSSIANAPDGNWYIGECIVHNTAWQIQRVWQFTTNPAPYFQRQMINGAWQPWARNTAGVSAGQRHQGGSVVQATDANGWMWITFPVAFSGTPAAVFGMNGDNSVAAFIVDTQAADWNSTSAALRAVATNWSPLANTTVRMNWMAIGPA
jgi:hypothetical protein